MFDIKIDGVKDVIYALELTKGIIEIRVHKLAERLLNEGYSIAVVGFAGAKYAGEKDVRVDPPTWEGDTLILRANGNSVAFIEFGTGKGNEEYPEPAMRTKIGAVGLGQYGKEKGANPPWIYLGEAGDLGEIKAYKSTTGQAIVSTVGNPPARAMYNASKVLDKDHIEKIAREVFR